MNFRISKQIFEKFDGVNIGLIIARNLCNTGVAVEIQNALREQEKGIRSKYTLENLKLGPEISVWRKAYTDFGAKPKDHRSSVENLYRLVLQGINLRQINNLVDIYNFISLKYMLPVGGEDLDKIKGNIFLTVAGSSELPVLLLGDKDPRPPHAGEVIYKDDISAICRRWNWREADRTKLTEQTRNCILVIEGLLPVTREKVENAVEELKTLVEKYCGGNTICAILNSTNPEIEF